MIQSNCLKFLPKQFYNGHPKTPSLNWFSDYLCLHQTSITLFKCFLEYMPLSLKSGLYANTNFILKCFFKRTLSFSYQVSLIQITCKNHKRQLGSVRSTSRRQHPSLGVKRPGAFKNKPPSPVSANYNPPPPGGMYQFWHPVCINFVTLV